jgi:hypothetical protein
VFVAWTEGWQQAKIAKYPTLGKSYAKSNFLLSKPLIIIEWMGFCGYLELANRLQLGCFKPKSTDGD